MHQNSSLSRSLAFSSSLLCTQSHIFFIFLLLSLSLTYWTCYTLISVLLYNHRVRVAPRCAHFSLFFASVSHRVSTTTERERSERDAPASVSDKGESLCMSALYVCVRKWKSMNESCREWAFSHELSRTQIQKCCFLSHFLSRIAISASVCVE